MISFDSPISSPTSPLLPLSGNYSFISPFWADVDTRPSNSGHVYYRQTTNMSLLIDAGHHIRALFPFDFPAFAPTFLFIVTWDQVGYYDTHTDKVMWIVLILC